MKPYIIFSFILITICNNSFSQLSISVALNKNLDTSKIKVFYIDGAVNNFIKIKFINNVGIVKEDIKSKYARLIFMYPNDYNQVPGLCFLVNNKSSSIKFNEVKKNVVNKLSNYDCKNLINVQKTKIYDQLNESAKKELNYFNEVSTEQNTLQSDSVRKLQTIAYETLALKQINFIKKNGNNYFYFETFIHDIIPSLKADHLLELYEVFNTAFPKKFTESYEGKSAKALLEGELFVKIGMQCPKFNAIDYLGNEISSEKLIGKYYILSFWASWCSPCLKEIPQLKNIRALYNTDKLNIISISRDIDSTNFINAVDKYKMNWVQIFNNPTLINIFGQKPIPSIYLIDENSKIIFSSWEKPIQELDIILKNKLRDNL